MNAPTPSWYDVLALDEDASTDHVRAAWKSAIADLDPTDRRFRMLNQAAEVLLDPAQRAAYDAGLHDEAPEPRPDETAPTVVAAQPTPVEPDKLEKREKPDEREKPEKPVKPERVAKTAGTDDASPEAAGIFTWPVLALSLVAVLLVSVTVLAAFQLRDGGETGGSGASAVSDQAAAASEVAQQAVVPILSYDYRTLEEDKAAAQSYMTDGYAEEYDSYFSAAVEANAPRTETVVDVTYLTSGIVRTGTDRVDVLVFIDRPTTNTQTPDPVVYKDQVTLQMVNVEGDWLVDGLVTSAPPAG